MNLYKKNFVKNFITFKNRKYLYKKKICEICGSKKQVIFQNIGKIGLRPGSYGYLPIAICSNCGHKFLSPRFSNLYYKKFYEEEYGKIPFKKIKPTKNYKSLQKLRGQKLFNFFTNKLKLKKPGKILDHGAATGLFLLPWKENNWDCYGIEPHKASVDYAKSIGLNVKNGFGEKLPYKNNYFDVIISVGSFEHAYDINKTFKEFHRTLKNNGVLILRWRSDKLLGSPLEYYNQITYRYFSRKTLIDLFNKHKLKYLFNESKKKIEGYDTYEYIVCKKTRNNYFTKFDTQSNSKIIRKSRLHNKMYYYTSLKLNNFQKTPNLKNKLNFIKKEKLGLMNIGRSKSINRVFFEMKSYLRALKQFHIFDENKK